MNGHMAVCHPLQPVQREETQENRDERKTSPAGLIDAYPLYLKYRYRPNKYYLIIQGGYSVPEKDVHRCRQDVGREGVGVGWG